MAIIKIPDGNAFKLRVTAMVNDVPADLNVVNNIIVNFVRRGRIAQPFGIDGNGRLVIANDGSLARGLYGVEFTGYHDGKPWRHYIKNAFKIVDENEDADTPTVVDDVPVYDLSDNMSFGGDGVTAAYVDAAIDAHNEDDEAHEALQAKMAGKVDDVLVDGESVVETDPVTGKRIVGFRKDQFGKVDDVKVNGESVLNENNEAEITVPTKTSELDNDEDFATNDEVDEKVAAHMVNEVNVSVDNTAPTGQPSAEKTFQNGVLDITFKNVKGEKGDPLTWDDLTEPQKESLKGRPGADFQPIEDVSGLSIAHSLGSDETKVMSQKGVTDELYEQRLSTPFIPHSYYIDNNDSWAIHRNANIQLYKLDRGDIVKVKANAQYPYVIAFISNTTFTGSVVYANGTDGRIIAPSENYEGSYYVQEPCYFYVLNNATTTTTDRTPAYIEVFSSKAENTNRDCNIYGWSDGVYHIARGLILQTATNKFIRFAEGNISHDTAFCKFYELNKGDVVKVKGNGTNTYAIAFIGDDVAWNEIPNKHQPTYVNGTTAPILASTVDEEKIYEVYEQCYLYVLGNTENLPIIVDRLPIVKVGKSISQPMQSRTMEAISAMKLTKIDATEIKGYYINANTNVWVENENGLYYLFNVKKGDVIVITPNEEREAAVAFLDSTSHVVGSTAAYAAWKSGVELVAEKTAFNVEEDCYLYVLNNASSIQTVRYPSEIGIRRGIFASTENRLTLLEENTRIGSLYDFEGEKPVFGYRYNLELLVELLSDMSAPTYTLHQGMAVYDNYLVAYGFNRNDSNNPSPTIGIYNITNGTLIAEIQLPYSPYIFPHGNSLSFGKNKLQSSSIMPPLYVTQWDGNKGVLVYDVTLEDETYAAELVQAIIPDMPDSDFTDKFGNGESDIVIDADNGKMYSMAYTLGTDGPYTDNDVTNPTKVCVFDLPEIDSTIEHVIGNSDVIEHFSLKSLPYRQGCCVHSGKLVIERGNTQASRIGRKVDIHIVNLKNREIITKIPLNEFCESNQSYQEPEGIAVYHGHLIMGWRGSRNIFKFVF